MVSIDFALFLEPGNFSEYLDYSKQKLQSLKKGRNFKSILFEEIQKNRNSIENTEFSEKEYELFQFSIDQNENLFYEVYSVYENLKNFTIEEKIEASIDIFFELIWQTNLNGFQIYQMKKRFVNDSKDYFRLKTKTVSTINFETDIQIEEVSDEDLLSYELPNFEKLRDIFINKDLFDKIDFSKLKQHNIIYKEDVEGFQLNGRSVSDFLVFISYLRKLKLIELEVGKNYLEITRKIVLKTIDRSADSSQISRIYKRIVQDDGSYELSKDDNEALFQVEAFFQKYL